MKIIRLFTLLAFSILLAGIFGCQSIDQPKGTSKGYSTYRFIDKTSGADARFEVPAEPVDRSIQAAIRDELESSGLVDGAGNSELVIAYLIIKQNAVSTTAVPTYYGDEFSDIQTLAHKKGVLKSTIPDQFERGAIVVDVFDTAKQKLIYRSFAVRDMKGVEESDQAELLIRSAVAEALGPFLQ